jgi:transcriptional regulator with XRE-family HTH domain
MTQLGQRLKSLRTERGLTQEQVARAAGIALATYVRIETGHTPDRPGRGTSTTVLEKLARALEVPIAALFEFPPDEELEESARPA